MSSDKDIKLLLVHLVADGKVQNNGENQTSSQEYTMFDICAIAGLDGPDAEKGYMKNMIQGKAKHATRVHPQVDAQDKWLISILDLCGDKTSETWNKVLFHTSKCIAPFHLDIC